MTRIIAGKAGSLRLEVPKAGTRPTSDRVREAVFSTLESWDLVRDTRVLDLYAGSGALGLEAASRGATSVTLVEKHPQAAQVAGRNARTVAAALARGTKQDRGAQSGADPDSSAPGGAVPEISVARQSVQAYLEGADPATRFDIVFIDPPYDLGEVELTANLTALAPLLAEGAAVMVERSSRSPEPTLPAGLAPIKQKRYGETVLWWCEPA